MATRKRARQSVAQIVAELPAKRPKTKDARQKREDHVTSVLQTCHIHNLGWDSPSKSFKESPGMETTAAKLLDPIGVGCSKSGFYKYKKVLTENEGNLNALNFRFGPKKKILFEAKRYSFCQ